MKKKFSSIIISFIIFANIVVPLSVFAAPTATFQFVIDKVLTNSTLRAWDFNINTVGIPNGTDFSIDILEGGTNSIITNYIKATINNNTAIYSTGYILKPGVDYKITATNPLASASFERITLGTAATPPVVTDTTTPWWFTGIDGGIRGLPTGYADLATCTTARNTYLSGFSATTATDVGACSQMTVAEAQLIETTRLNRPVGGTVPISSVGDIKNNTTYTLLAPIPGMPTCMDWSGKNPNCLGNDIGKYLNIIFKLLIGICIALAVIMLIVYGFLYMGEESVFGKVEAKSKMLSAIFGLIIAIGAWALLNTINPALTGAGGLALTSANSIVPLYDRGVNDPKNPVTGESVRCTPVTNPSSPCTVANLTPIFGANNAVAMSKICNMESGGTSIASGTDVCKPGNTPFSFGLFQINLSANGAYAGPECVGLFNKAVTGADAIIPKYNSGFTCNLIPGKDALYNACKAKLLNPATNLAIAKSLFTADKKAWTGDKVACASAFQ